MTGGSCGRQRPIWGGKPEHTRSMAATRARRAPPRASMARASPRSCSAFPDELDLRNAQQLRRARQQPRCVRARRLARIRSPHVEPRPSLRPRDRPHRGGEPQHRRVRSDDVESDRSAGARQLRRESAGGRADRGVGVQRSRRLHLSVRRSAVGVERGQEQLPAARGLHLQAHGKLRSAGRRRAVHRAVSDSRCAGHHDGAQSNRVLAQHAGSGDAATTG